MSAPRYNLDINQATSFISAPITIPAAAGPAVSLWSLVADALAAAPSAIIDSRKVVGFCINGQDKAGNDLDPFVYGGEDTAGNGGSTGGNSYCAAGDDLFRPIADPEKMFLVAPASPGTAVDRVAEIYFVDV